MATMRAAPCVLLMCVLCVLWCGAAAASVETVIPRDLLLLAADEAENMAAEGITLGYEAMSWQRGLLSNATLLLSSFDDVLSNVSRASEAVSGIKQPQVKKKVQLAVTNLEWKTKAAKAATLKIRNLRGTAAGEREKIAKMQEVDVMAEEAREAAASSDNMEHIAATAQRLRRAAKKAEDAWRETVQRAGLQLAAAKELIDAMKGTKEETEKMEALLADEHGEDVDGVKGALMKSMEVLDTSALRAAQLGVTAQTLHDKGEHARNAYEGAAARAAALETQALEMEKVMKAAEEEAKRRKEEEEAKRRREEEEAKRKREEEEEARRKAEEEEAKRQKEEEEEEAKRKRERSDGSTATAFGSAAIVLVCFVVLYFLPADVMVAA